MSLQPLDGFRILDDWNEMEALFDALAERLHCDRHEVPEKIQALLDSIEHMKSEIAVLEERLGKRRSL